MDRRQKKEIFAKIWINAFLLLLFWLLANFLIVPWIKKIDLQKQDLKKIYEEFIQLEKTWLTFEEFKNLDIVKDDARFKNILPNLQKDFYDSNYINNTDEFKNFEAFLQDKEKDVSKVKNSNLVESRESVLSAMLPKFTQAYSVNGASTDLDFVNYIETIFSKFNIEFEWEISLEELLPVGWSDDLKSWTKTISNNLFYIPLELKIIWKKSDIINFLYFISNVNIIDKDLNSENDLSEAFYDDGLFDRMNLGGISYNTVDLETPNKYITRMMSIESIKISDYFDQSSEKRNVEEDSVLDYISFLNSDDKDKFEEYELELTINMYSRWLGEYTIRNELDSINQTFNVLKAKIAWELNKLNKKVWEKDIDTISKLTSLNKYLLALEPQAKIIWTRQKDEDINKKYVKAKDLEYSINRVLALFNEIIWNNK